MKIIMCSTRMGIGGAETHVLTLSRELCRQGHRVLVLSSGGILEDELRASGIRHERLPLDRKDPLSVRKCRHGILSAVRDFSPDIIHAHGRIPAFVCGSLRRKKGFPPVVTTVHGMYDASLYKKPLSYWGERTAAVSDDIRNYLIGEYGLPGSRITVIPNGTAVRPRSEKPHRGINILMCSRLDHDTAGPVADVLSLMKPLTVKYGEYGLKLTVAGDGKDLTKLKDAARAVPDGSVLFAGPVTDLSPYFDTADLFIGSSRSLIEAMAAGIPSVMLSASPEGSVCEGLMTAGAAGRLFRNNYVNRDTEKIPLYECLCTAISGLKDNPGAYRAEAEACMKFTAKHNSIVRTTSQTVEFYRGAISGTRPGIMLCGYFGAGNTGDDAVLETAAKRIRGLIPEAVVYAMTDGKSLRRGKYTLPEGVVPVVKDNPLRTYLTLKKCRLFVLCGGSLLQNATSNRSLFFYTGWFGTAHRLGCRTMISGGGIGPIYGRSAMNRLTHTLALSDYAGFRDTSSLLYASEICPEKKFVLSSDHALLTACDASAADNNGEYVAFCPREIPHCRRRNKSSALSETFLTIASMLAAKGKKILWVALSPDDEKLCSSLCASLPGSRMIRPESAAGTIKLFSGCAFTVSVRLHGAVLAVRAGVPSVCVGYDPKVISFAKDAALPCVMPEDVFPEAICDCISRLPTRRETADLYPVLAQRCLADYDAAESLWRATETQ